MEENVSGTSFIPCPTFKFWKYVGKYALINSLPSPSKEYKVRTVFWSCLVVHVEYKYTSLI